MNAVAPHERLSRARAERGEDLERLSARTGLRVHHVRAIEAGRFADLPPGIYARAAIRSLAVAYALDADDILRDCEALLPRVDDPIEALARLRGVAPAAEPATAAAAARPAGPLPGWRTFAAASVDGAIAGALLAAAGAGAALLARVSPAALQASAGPLFLIGLFLGAGYYIWLGGLAGTTMGEIVVGGARRARDPRPLTLRAIALRTLAAATADARGIRALGQCAGRRLILAGRSVRPPAPSPSPPRSLDRVEALTWSMRGRASVPPPPRRRPRG